MWLIGTLSFFFYLLFVHVRKCFALSEEKRGSEERRGMDDHPPPPPPPARTHKINNMAMCAQFCWT